MKGHTTMSDLSKAQRTKLATIIEATQSETGMAYMSQKSVQKLVDGEYVECNIQMTDAKGNVAVRATQKGIAIMSDPATTETPTAEAQAPATATTPVYAVESGTSMPALTRARSGATSIYPFDALEAPVKDETSGDVTYSSFFVPATEKRPDPAKSLASTVSTASKRYATVDGKRTINRRNKETGDLEPHEVDNYVYERKFVVRKVEGGARVFRTL